MAISLAAANSRMPVAEAEHGGNAVRARDDGDMRCRAALAADDAADTLERRPRKIPGADIVGDEYSSLGNAGKVGLFLAQQCERDLATDRVYIVGSSAQITVLDRVEFRRCRLGCTDHGGHRVHALTDQSFGVTDQSFIGGDVHQRRDDGAIAFGKRGIGQRRRHPRADLCDGSEKALDFRIDFVCRQRMGLPVDFFGKIREGRADRRPFARGYAAQAAIDFFNRSRFGSCRGAGAFHRRRFGAALFFEAGTGIFEIADQRLDGFGRVRAVRTHGDFLVLLDREQHQLDRAFRADGFALLDDLDLGLETLGEPDEARRGTRVKAFMHSDDGRAFHSTTLQLLANQYRRSGCGDDDERAGLQFRDQRFRVHHGGAYLARAFRFRRTVEGDDHMADLAHLGPGGRTHCGDRPRKHRRSRSTRLWPARRRSVRSRPCAGPRLRQVQAASHPRKG